MIKDFCSHTPELTLTFTLTTPLQLNYGITYLAVLWNHLPLAHLNNVLIISKYNHYDLFLI